uniref:RNA helicase n=1 Tax=Aegilops tauschii TaxID=37682 RepID=M8AXW3_AEGTA
MDRTSVSSKGGASTLENVDEWKWKLHMLLRNDNEQEIMSREKKDRRDFDQLAQLADRMGLHSRQYSRIIVFSKVPLPNYRSDLDDKRPQREVSIPSGLQREVDALLADYLARKRTDSGNFPNAAFSRSSSTDSFATDESFYEQQDNQTSTNVVMERIQRRKSLQLRNQQAAWQESNDGQSMMEFRRSLPAQKERQSLLEAISQNQVVVVSGETGCGKTTQLPQYILESEIEAARGATCSIICTQPRRISAISVSERVAAERGEKIGESVGYKVRLEGMRGRDTRLLFCTTGVLLRRLLVDRSLKGVTHVIVDEIHERGMNEDFLLIVLKDLLPRRPELRLVLMSATLNAEMFSSYFGGAPMIHIPGFTYPVRSRFLEDILEVTGHRLTPYNQIDDYGQEKSWKMQKQALRKRKSQIASVVEDAVKAADLRDYSPQTRDSLSCWNPDSIGFNLIENVLCHICQKERDGAVLVFMTGWDDINTLKDQLQSNPLLGDPSKVLLLACHGSMASSEQKLIFDKPEPGVRKIVLATNLAETSITINDVVFVVDCGKAKETSYDALNNTPCLLPTWISKASARQVQNAIEYLKVLGAFDQNEELTVLGKHLSMLPVEPKLGKMLIFGAIFNCLDPILTIVAGLSVRDPFMTPFDKKDLAESAKLQFSCRDYSDHLAIVRAYDGWREAERDRNGYDYCWRNFLSAQTLKALDSLRRQFLFLLKDTGLIDENMTMCNKWSRDENLVRAIICAGLYPGVSSVVNKEKSVSLKTMEDGQVMLYSSSVNGKEAKIPFPWLVFNEKVKVNSVFLRDSTAISDSILLLFGGNIQQGGLDGHLKMLGGYLEFFMSRDLASTYLNLKGELENLIHCKLQNPRIDIQTSEELLSAVRLLVTEDPCSGRFVYGRQEPRSKKAKTMISSASVVPMDRGGGGGHGGDNPKNQLQTLLTRAGHDNPSYKTKQIKNTLFRSTVEFNGMQFVGQPCANKKLAEKDAAGEAISWLTGGEAPPVTANVRDRQDADHMSVLTKPAPRRRRHHHRRS